MMADAETQRTISSALLTLDSCYLVIPVFIMSTILTLSIRRARRQKYPPGPDGVPFFGNLFSLDSHPLRLFKKWSLEKYGPVMSVKYLDRNVVVLNNYDVIKEVFVNRSLVSSGRAQSFLFSQIQGNYGLTFINFDRNLIKQKEMGQSCFVSFGSWDGIINSEVDMLVEKLNTIHNKPVEIRVHLFNATANILSNFIFGRRFDYEGNELKQFFHTFDNILGEDGKLLALIELKPFLRHFPPFTQANNRFITKNKGSMELISSIIENIKANPDSSNSFVKCFLDRQKPGCDDAHQFSKNQLVAYIRDVLGAGVKNVYVTIYWAILCAFHYPEHLKQMVEEIDSRLGQEKPSNSIEFQLPFTCAFIQEVFRICSPLPKTLDHKCLSEIKIMGYTIPPNTLISGNLWGAHHDPETWKDPDTFNPNRHISSSGEFMRSEKVIPFSMGPRSCFGEKIGRVMVHTMLIRILQNFEISPCGCPPDLCDGREGVTADPENFDVLLKRR